jgi:excisionase family DNA binding protein
MSAYEREMTTLAISELLAATAHLQQAVTHLHAMCSQPAEFTAGAREDAVKDPGLELLTVEETAAVLRTGPRRVRDMIDDGELPTIRYGRRIMIRRSAIAAWLAAQERTHTSRPSRRRRRRADPTPPESSGTA